jgi:acyl dehydratase
LLPGALDAHGAHTSAIVPAIVIEAIAANTFCLMGDLLCLGSHATIARRD